MGEKIEHIYFGASSVLTALGDRKASLDCLSAGKSGIAPDGRYGMMTAAIPPAAEKSCRKEGYTRFEGLVISQIEKVCRDSGIGLDRPDVQLILSTTKGNIDLLSGSLDHIDERCYLYHAAERIAGYFRAASRPIVISNACISGVSAFVVAERWMVTGKCRHVVIAGGDILCDFVTRGFASFKSISERPCRPYDRDRNGLTLGEAVGAVLLSTDRHLAEEPLVELSGGSVSNDANHISGPSRTGDGLYFAIRDALAESGFGVEEVGFVNTHGTATAYNDEMESKAVAWAGLSETPLNSVKGYIGHTLGASGVVETIFCADEIRLGRVYGTIGYEHPGTPCPVNVSAERRTLTRPVCVKTASGFGGCNAAIVLAGGGLSRGIEIPRVAVSEKTGHYCLSPSEQPFSEYIRAEFHRLGHPNMKFYKMSDLCKALYVSVEHLLKDSEVFSDCLPERRAIILSNRVSSLEADSRHQSILNDKPEEGPSPAVFVYTLPNVAAGEMCIRHKIQGDNTFFIENEETSLTEDYARFLIESGKADAVICGFCDKLGEKWKVDVNLLTIRNI